MAPFSAKNALFWGSEIEARKTTTFGRLLGRAGGRGGACLTMQNLQNLHTNFSTPCSPFGGAANLLSFAPSAAAGWHGDRQRIPYARNGAGHSAFSSVGLCRRFLGTGIVLYCIVLYCIVLFCIALHCIPKRKNKKKRRNARPFLVLCLRFSHPKPLKNKAECWPFFAYLRRKN